MKNSLNSNLTEKQSLTLIAILSVFLIFIWVYFFPYKEVLECKNMACSIQKFYIDNRHNNTNYFSRTDTLFIAPRWRARILGGWDIINSSDTSSLFKNTFGTKSSAIKALENLESDKEIIITKYAIGHITKIK